MKIVVYAICKNEEKHIKRWYQSMSEADEIYVLDTGSVDDSVNLLKSMGVNVKEKNYETFKFDEARNDALQMVPLDTDICVCTDLDEVFSKGWRKEIERIWKTDTDRIKYNLNFSFNSKNEGVMSYFISKIHTRNNYRWVNSIHEVLKFTLNRQENIILSDKININHYPDKEKNRDFYLDLLINEVKNNPNDERNLHYLGREYMYKEMFNESIDTLIKHVKISHWDEEKASSCRYIAYCYARINRVFESVMWLKKSIEIMPDIREGYVLLGMLYYDEKRYSESIEYLLIASNITNKSTTYINEEYAWNENIYDILSLDYFYIKDIDNSIKYVKKALKVNPSNERIRNNYKIIKKLKKNKI